MDAWQHGVLRYLSNETKHTGDGGKVQSFFYRGGRKGRKEKQTRRVLKFLMQRARAWWKGEKFFTVKGRKGRKENELKGTWIFLR